jgi:hypothetical protein
MIDMLFEKEVGYRDCMPPEIQLDVYNENRQIELELLLRRV